MRLARYEVFPGIAGAWRWRLVSANGETVASGEGYVTAYGARRGIDAHRRAACTQRVVQLPARSGGGIGGPGEE